MEAMVHARARPDPAAPAQPIRSGARSRPRSGCSTTAGVAVVEQAQASGLWRVATVERDAVGATSHGTGELIAAAIESGAREVVVTVGGSATSDGGRGALEALGARFTSRSADLRELRRRLRGVRLSVACDVRNPMVGPEGARTRLRAPEGRVTQAGRASSSERLRAWARAGARDDRPRSRRASRWPARAAGWPAGCGRSPAPTLRPGAALVLDTVGFDARCARCVRGRHRRGPARRADASAASSLFEVATRCRQGGVPCYAVVGEDDLDAFEHRLMNIEVEAAARNGTDRVGARRSSTPRAGVARRLLCCA